MPRQTNNSLARRFRYNSIYAIAKINEHDRRLEWSIFIPKNMEVGCFWHVDSAGRRTEPTECLYQWLATDMVLARQIAAFAPGELDGCKAILDDAVNGYEKPIEEHGKANSRSWLRFTVKHLQGSDALTIAPDSTVLSRQLGSEAKAVKKEIEEGKGSAKVVNFDDEYVV